MSHPVNHWVNKALGIPHPKNIRLEIRQYDSTDAEVSTFYTQKFFSIPDYQNFYYRINPFFDTPRGKAFDTHFGIKVSNEGSNNFDIGIYFNQLLNYLIQVSSQENLLTTMNGNLSFHYEQFDRLSKLEHDPFERELSSFLSTYPFFYEIKDLNEVKNKAGLYILVLDDYACCYIGQSRNIKTRIQQHWSKTNYCTTGIDMFKALDTTRIYATHLPKKYVYDLDFLEYQFIHTIDRKYLLNFLGGGGSLEFIHLDSPTLGYRSNHAQ